MRYLGLDVHRDFCEVAICERGRARSVGRIDTTRDALELFASSLARRRPGRVGIHRQRAGDRRHPAPPRRQRRARQPDAGSRDQPRQGQERPRRRPHPGGAAGGRSAPAGLDRRRAHARAAAAHLAPHPARPPAHADQERGVRGPGAQPDRAARRQRSVRQGRPPLDGHARAARRRAPHARRLPAPDRLPRRRNSRSSIARSPSACSPPATCDACSRSPASMPPPPPR